MPHRDRPDDQPTDTPAHRPRPGITIISASVGAGHDGAADELADRLRSAGFTVDRYDFLDLLPAGLGALLSGTYRRMLRSTPESYQRIYAALERTRRPGPVLRVLLRCAQRRTLRILRPGTEAVVSTYPGASQVLGALRRQRRLKVPALTFLTDFSVHPLWIAPGIDAHLAAHPIPAAQARTLGAARVMVAGPVARPGFRPSTEPERRAARRQFGLPDGAALALLVAGSWGVGAVRRSAAEIRDSGAAHPVVVCGQNNALARQLRADGFEYVRGWEEDMPGLMRACDVLVQNAGGLTSLEAFAGGLPVLSYRCIPGHGQTNAAALDAAGLAVWVKDAEDLGAALTELADGPLGQRQRAAGLALHPPGPGPAAVIAAAASGAVPPVVPAPRPGRRSVAPRRVVSAAAALAAAAVSLGVGLPLARSHVVDPDHLSSVTHGFLARYER